MLSILAGLSALTYVILTLWYVFGDLPNPLPIALFANVWVAGPTFRWLLGLICITLVCIPITGLFIATSRIVLVGWSQFIAEEKEIADQEKQTSTRQIGELVSVQADHGNSSYSDTSIVETTKGYYRVHGKVSKAKKGEPVTIRTKSTVYFRFEMVCLDGKEYQLAE